MFIDATKLNLALSRVNAIACLDKNQPGILFHIENDKIGVYYNSQSKAIICNVPVTLEDGDITGDVVFDYKRLADTVSHCKTNGNVKVENIEAKFNKNSVGPGTAVFRAVKTVDTLSINENGVQVYEPQVVCTNNYELSWFTSEQLSVRQKILMQPACENMYDNDGADGWDRDELIRVIGECTNEDAKVMYMSPKYNGAFALNTNSTVYVKSKADVNSVVQLQTNCAKAISAVLSSIESDDVELKTIKGADDKLYACLVYTPDQEVSVYMAVATPSRTDITNMARCYEFDYKTYQANVMTAVLKDILKTAVDLSAGTKGSIEFVRGENGVEAVIKAVDTGASVSNTYRIKCASFNTAKEATDTGKILSIEVDFKLLLDLVNTSKTEYTGLDFSESADNLRFRIGFLNLEKALKVRDAYKLEHGIEKMSLDDKLEIRSKYVETCYYIAVKQL